MTIPVVVTIIVQSILLIIGMFKIWMDTQLKIKELDIRVQSVENQDRDIKRTLDKVLTAITDLKVQLSEKQDRI
jgi:hypothetical protein